jgi:ABC-type amino acid transport substrate-binding protein
LKSNRLLNLVLSVVVLAVVLGANACGSVSQSTNATVYGEGTEQRTAAAAAADNAIASISKSPDIETPATLSAGILFVGSDSASPPLEYLAVLYTVEAGEETKQVTLVGFEWDLARAVAKKMGLEAQYVQTSWKDLIPGIEEGRLDILASARSTTPDPPEELGATETYLDADLAICTAKGTTSADQDALKGKIVGVQLGSPAQTVVEQIDGITEVRNYAHILRAFDDLNSGGLDAAVADGITAEWILDNSASYGATLTISGQIETGEGYAFWCAKENQELLTAMNTALAELRAEDVYQKICRKWRLTGN